LARWLATRGVEAHVIHASSLAVSREHRRAKTDRLDTELLKRGFFHFPGLLVGPIVNVEGTGFELLVRGRGECSAAMLRCTNLFFTQQAPRVGGSPHSIVVSRRWIPFGSRTKRVFIARAREGRDSLSEANGILAF
jgi:hypothetical protein